MDFNTLIPVIIIVVAFIFCMPFIIWLINLLLKRHDRLQESPIDVHEMIYHKRKKAGKRNIKNFRTRRVVCLGDGDYPSVDYGRLVALIFSRDCTDIFVKTSAKPWIRAVWCRVPNELVRDVFGRNIRIECRGFTPYENYLAPIYCLNVSKGKRVYYENILDRDFLFATGREKNGELTEQNVNAMIEAINPKRKALDVYSRDDHMREQGAPTAKEEELNDGKA